MSDQYFFEKEWKFLLYRKTAYYLGLVMILMQGYLDKFKVSGRKSAKFVSGPFLSLWEIFGVFISHNDCFWPGGLSWTQSHCAGSRVLLKKYIIPVYVLLSNEKKARIWYKVCAWHVNIALPSALLICASSNSLKENLRSFFLNREMLELLYFLIRCNMCGLLTVPQVRFNLGF